MMDDEEAPIIVLGKMRSVFFNATEDEAKEISAYGKLVGSSYFSRYFLTVDQKHNFDEVVARVENYGK